MMQYTSIKEQHPDAILLFRVGDFYETFGEDAEKAADVLGIILTSRNNGGSKIALAGFPYHSLDVYLPKLIRAGFRVAICEQLEKPSKEKKIVKRGVTDLVTPGLTTNENILETKSNNYLASIYWSKNNAIGLAFIDISTGEYLVSEGNSHQVLKLLQSYQPAEIIYSEHQSDNYIQLVGNDYYGYTLDDWVFKSDYTEDLLKNLFEVSNFKGFGIEELENGRVAAGAILHYLESTQNKKLDHIKQISRIVNDDFLWMDRFTIRNLEMIQSLHATGTSLIDVLDKTISPMGSRLLRKWILFPLLHKDLIDARHQVISHLLEHVEEYESIQNQIKPIGDLERVAAKIAVEKVTPRDFLQLQKALNCIKELGSLCKGSTSKALKKISDRINYCEVLNQDIATQILEDAPAVVAKGSIFKQGHNETLDELNHIIFNSKDILVEIQQNEAAKTGIANLKIGFNNVFGYYLEVTNKYKNQGLIPDDWIRKQTLTNAERYITEELKKIESKILNAEQKKLDLELKLYEELIHNAKQYLPQLLANAKCVAEIDCLASLTAIAQRNDYCKPSISDSNIIQIKQGRHPVIEQELKLGEAYIPNDLLLDSNEQQIIMITGPNMSGKSAILRQTALICLMAQMGSYVPAESAEIGIIDKLFTRVGASDNISSGESTFMVEMNETASIMNSLTDRSLVLLDEIGRGTSTYDGISIAWSLAEYLHNHPTAKAKTLFATHYHELNELASKYDRIKNYNVATREVGSKVIFLRKLVAGGSKHSFGIHVAKMAGMPNKIIKRAAEILKELEQKSISASNGEIKDTLNALPKQSMQLQFFEAQDPVATALLDAMTEIDINTMTPIDCMMKLKELTESLRN